MDINNTNWLTFFKDDYEMLRAVDLSYLGAYGAEYYTELINGGNNLKLYIYSTENPSNNTFYWSPYSFTLKFNNADYIEISNLDIRGGANTSIRIDNNVGWKVLNCNIGQNAGQGLVRIFLRIILKHQIFIKALRDLEIMFIHLLIIMITISLE